MTKLNLDTKKGEGAGYNMNYEPTMFIFFFKYQQINVWPFNTCVSRNNTLIEAQNYFRNKTSTDTAVQTFTSKHQYATCMSTNVFFFI